MNISIGWLTTLRYNLNTSFINTNTSSFIYVGNIGRCNNKHPLYLIYVHQKNDWLCGVVHLKWTLKQILSREILKSWFLFFHKVENVGNMKLYRLTGVTFGGTTNCSLKFQNCGRCGGKAFAMLKLGLLLNENIFSR